jgi:S-ribosylhomocysteine lyase LuxS involved in autoinducer biosynthesis
MYTSDQIGEIEVKPINSRTIDQFSILLIQPNNEQVLVVEPCSWPKAARRVKEMIMREIDPFDIRFTMRNRDQLETDGLPLKHVNEGLFWIRRDFERALTEGLLSSDAISMSKRYFEIAE